MYDPWEDLRGRPHIRIVWTELNYTSATTDGHGIIWMDKDLLQDERRCSLAHELVHIDFGHYSCQQPAIEMSVRLETARRLIAFDDLLYQFPRSNDFHDLAENLWVTQRVLADRVNFLSDEENQLIDLIGEDMEQAC